MSKTQGDEKFQIPQLLKEKLTTPKKQTIKF